VKATDVTREHELERPDGAGIHWFERGSGAGVVILPALWSPPGIYQGLIEDLARDRRVITYDPRGSGRSTVTGPYVPAVDAADLEAVLDAAGSPVLAIGVADGLFRAARVAVSRPDLIHRLVSIAPSPAAILPRSELAGSGVMGASESVIDMLLTLLETDPRMALRTMISAVNPDLHEEQVRQRVDATGRYLRPDAAAARARAWIADDVRDELCGLGDRLSLIYGGPDPLFEGALARRFGELFPDARTVEVADGPVSRPELTAALVRSLT